MSREKEITSLQVLAKYYQEKYEKQQMSLDVVNKKIDNVLRAWERQPSLDFTELDEAISELWDFHELGFTGDKKNPGGTPY